MIPITRKENYLNEIVGWGETAPEKPLTPEEFFFAAILGEVVQTPEPLSRYQIYLAKIAGRNISVPKPLTRIELFLAKACGMDIETPTPITREEIFWSNYSAIVDFEVEGVPPLTYKAIEGTLENYRIYGNTVGGESVGDRTGNLFDGELADSNVNNTGAIVTLAGFIVSIAPVKSGVSYTISRNTTTNVYAFYDELPTNGSIAYDETRVVFNSETVTFTAPITGYIAVRSADTDPKLMINSGSTPLPYEPYGYKVPVTVEGKNLLLNTAKSQTINGVTFTMNSDRSVTCNGQASSLSVYKIPIYLYASTLYILNGCPFGGSGEGYSADLRYSDVMVSSRDIGTGINYTCTQTGTYAYGIRIAPGYTCDNITFYPMIRKADIEDDTYEPYHAPVTVPIYLPEQIRKVGDDAEYIDFAEQKMHRIGADDVDVTLPALPTLTGTNVLSVGTEVQPSKVYVKYKGERQ